MQIIISNSIEKPIYEQIYDNIKNQILTGELIGDELLPSIRTLAKDLRISNITTKRAYEELTKDGYIEARSSKGYYVKSKSQSYLKEEILTTIENKISEIIQLSNVYNITKDELFDIINNLYEED